MWRRQGGVGLGRSGVGLRGWKCGWIGRTGTIGGSEKGRSRLRSRVKRCGGRCGGRVRGMLRVERSEGRWSIQSVDRDVRTPGGLNGIASRGRSVEILSHREHRRTSMIHHMRCLPPPPHGPPPQAAAASPSPAQPPSPFVFPHPVPEPRPPPVPAQSSSPSLPPPAAERPSFPAPTSSSASSRDLLLAVVRPGERRRGTARRSCSSSRAGPCCGA